MVTGTGASQGSGVRIELGVPGWRERVADAPRLSAEEERELIRRAQAGDEAARDRLIRCNLRLVLGLSMKLRRYGVPIAELMSEGTLGLMEAVGRFDVSRELRFATYASSWVRAFVLQRLAAEMAPLGAARGAFRTKYWFALRRESARLANQGVDGRDRVRALAQRLGVSENKTEEMLSQLHQRCVPVVDERRPEEDSSGTVALTCDGPLPDEQVARQRQQSRLEVAVAQALDLLKPRERELVRRRLMSDDPPSLADIGRSEGISRERARQLEVRSKEILRRRLRPVVVD